MKKILTNAFAFVLCILMLCAIACSTASPDITYDGNYTSIDVQDLYTATKGVETFVPAPNANNEKTGKKINASYNYVVETNEYDMSETITFTSAYISTLIDGNSISTEGSLQITDTYESIVGGVKSTTLTAYNIYLKNNSTYIHTIVSSTVDGENQKTEYKYKSYESDFYDIYTHFYETINPNLQKAPYNQNDFLTFIDTTTNVNGLKITADVSDKIKVKVEVGDKDKFAPYAASKNEYIGFDTQILKFGINYVFNANKSFVALKYESGFKFSSPYGINKINSYYEEKVYDGSISYPADIDSYTELQ